MSAEGITTPEYDDKISERTDTCRIPNPDHRSHTEYSKNACETFFHVNYEGNMYSSLHSRIITVFQV